jgi:hypothetical protein
MKEFFLKENFFDFFLKMTTHSLAEIIFTS